MGEVWERVMRSVRKVLRCFVKEQLLSEEGIRTLMAELESISNGRPLTLKTQYCPLCFTCLCCCFGFHGSEASIVFKCAVHNGQYWVFKQ